MDLDKLSQAIRRSWAADTSDDADIRTPENPARGQCAVTAMVVRDYLGGTLRIAPVLRDGEPVEMHCWNVLPSGRHLDLTTDQFDYEHELGEPIDREPVVDHTGTDRHQILARRVEEQLSD